MNRRLKGRLTERPWPNWLLVSVLIALPFLAQSYAGSLCGILLLLAVLVGFLIKTQ
jgi:hypothetical protein